MVVIMMMTIMLLLVVVGGSDDDAFEVFLLACYAVKPERSKPHNPKH